MSVLFFHSLSSESDVESGTPRYCLAAQKRKGRQGLVIKIDEDSWMFDSTCKCGCQHTTRGLLQTQTEKQRVGAAAGLAYLARPVSNLVQSEAAWAV